MSPDAGIDVAAAAARDAADPLGHLRDRFEFPRRPRRPDGEPLRYFCGNSLGLLPRRTRTEIARVLDDWSLYAVDGHFEPDGRSWYRYDEPLAAAMAPLVGAHPDEVAVMDTLTADIHLLLASFYRPTPDRHRLVMLADAFPSDRYALASQAAWHGFDPVEAVVEVTPDGHGWYPPERLEAALDDHGERVALVWVEGVNYRTGERLDLARWSAIAHRHGALFGADLAHAAGNVPVDLHRADVDVAAWCTYKYLNAGPGGPGAVFVHRRHAGDVDRHRLAGWWGNDPETRFAMDTATTFVPRPTADGWKLSNPSILALAPLRASLDIFTEATIPALRQKSVVLTGRLASLLRGAGIDVVTPSDPERRGAQLSLRFPGRAEEVHRALDAAGVIGDLRAPDIVRLTPAPLYTRHIDVETVAEIVMAIVEPNSAAG